jgi:hypothetical protein
MKKIKKFIKKYELEPLFWLLFVSLLLLPIGL